MGTSSLRLALLSAAVGLVSACAEDTTMQGQSFRSEPPPAQTAEAQGVAVPDPKTKTINHSVMRESERVVESFVYPAIEALSDAFKNPLEPLAVKSFTWTPSDDQSKSMTVTAGGPVTDAKTKTAPIQTVDQIVNKVGIVAILDSSETFVTDTMTERAKLALDAALTQLYADNQDFYFQLCGLEGTTNSIVYQGVDKGSMTLAQAKTAVRAAADTIFMTTGAGAEKPFRSAKLCLSKIPAAELAPLRARGFLFLTDAPNCKDNSNRDSTECDRSSAAMPDHHLHLWTHTNGLGKAKNLSALAVMYRRTDGVCGAGDKIEVPNANEVFEQGSQFADAVKKAFDVLYPAGAGAPNSYNQLMGDICASAYDTSPATQLVKVVTNIRKHRVPLSTTYSVFPSGSPYNLQATVGGVVTAAEDRGGVVVAQAEGDVVVTHHVKNNYDALTFALSGNPEVGSTVDIWWDGAKQISCPAGTSFGTTEPRCRWSAPSLYLRDIDVLPATAPNPASERTKAFELRYVSAAMKTQTVSFTADDLIAPDSVVVTSWPSAAEPRIAQFTKTLSTDGKTATLRFGTGDLPTGVYVAKYKTMPSRTFVHDLTLAAGNNYVCVKADAAVGIDSGALTYPADATVPCTLSADGSSVAFRGTSAQPLKFNAAFKVEVRPAPSFTLAKAPDLDGIVVTTFTTAGAPRANSGFTLDGQKIVLSVVLAPGESAKATYKRTPPQPDGRFALVSTASDSVYDVTLTSSVANEPLAQGADYEIAAAAGKAAVKVLRPVAPGSTLVVKYTSLSNAVETSTETEQ